MADMTVIDFADTPLPVHGDTEAKFTPVANSAKMREVAAATTAPARIADHDTADVFDSIVVGPRPTARWVIVSSIWEPLSDGNTVPGAGLLESVLLTTTTKVRVPYQLLVLSQKEIQVLYSSDATVIHRFWLRRSGHVLLTSHAACSSGETSRDEASRRQ